MPGFTVSTLGSAVNSKPTPIYKYTWDIVNLFGAVPNSTSPLIYVKDASMPSWVIEKEEVPGASLKYKFAKGIIFNDIKITWYDTDGLANIVKAWRGMVWTPDDGLKDPRDYKRNSILRSLTYDLLGNVDWTLFNSWPSSVVTGDVTYSDSDVKLVEVTVSYDWAEEGVQLAAAAAAAPTTPTPTPAATTP